MSQQPQAGMLLPRIVGAAFGLFFAGVGLTVAISCIVASGWGSPPLFFRIVGILFGILFLCVGGAMAFGALTAKVPGSGPPSAGGPGTDVARGPAGPPVGTAYACPSCAAPLDEKADVSPLGDVKCQRCGRWFNIHGRH